MLKKYDIKEVEPYINWLYFYHAWGLSGKPREEKEKLRKEAEAMLQSWCGKYYTHAIFRLFEAESEGDDLLIFPSEGHVGSFSSDALGGSLASSGKKLVRFPMLRQQQPREPGEPNLCLADFILPKGMRLARPLAPKDIANHVGMFCVTVDAGAAEAYRHDEYLGMMAQTLCDRLAEATAEKLHEEVRRHYWGYAPDEQLTIQQQHREEYQGIRPAIGYPSLPDTSATFLIDQLLDMRQVGIRLTETGMMTPHASVSGLMFAHPKARYFELGKIGADQLRDYARRRGVPVELMKRFLLSSLLK